MRYSQSFIFTAREVPAEAEVMSHKLMLRGGYVKKLAAGVYSYLPLAWRVIRKVENIIREEMNRAGAEELLMPAVLPAELWQETGRWQKYGPELLRFQDRHKRDFCIGPTHEEIITDIVRSEVRSYRHLPKNLYQIQTKFRDEIRPRFGLMRGREFIMKDAYSFDVDDAGANANYQAMYKAYQQIFKRCGLQFKAVEADSGQIGGNYSHEFMVLAQSGEDAIASCTTCEYAANVEKAEIGNRYTAPAVQARAHERIHTPNVRTMEELAAFLSVPASALLKSVVFMDEEGKVVLACIRGDREINQIKLEKVAGKTLHPADAAALQQAGLVAGSIAPLDLPASVTLYMDSSVQSLGEIITGGNEADWHLRGISLGELPTVPFIDISVAQAGDTCPRCQGTMEVVRGIEVGHVFKLGTVYSEKLKATYLDQNGKAQLIIMGCYGIGVGRTAAAAIEQNHDENGIIWPMAIAPYQLVICSVNPKKDEAVREVCDQLYAELGVRYDVLYDDRDERPGVKFKDSELIGIPLRVTMSKNTLEEQSAEIVVRRTGEKILCPLAEVPETIARLIAAGMEV
ncbi:proline--tRNA ligase [Chrysiogenes arsenatis]|uniref:proline--tRNA ligase n=1 Tax=Chrysiogenes arsenatis TaxID=309797 RepID=UPI00041999A9|nr:proline--tRNA ligase [Chrysiogenes arsenatis]